MNRIFGGPFDTQVFNPPGADCQKWKQHRNRIARIEQEQKTTGACYIVKGIRSQQLEEILAEHGKWLISLGKHTETKKQQKGAQKTGPLFVVWRVINLKCKLFGYFF